MHYQGKPLLQKISAPFAGEVLQVAQRDFAITYLLNGQQPFDTPAPVATPDWLWLPANTSHLCLYPRYQYQVDQSQFVTQFEPLFLSAETLPDEVRMANQVWPQQPAVTAGHYLAALQHSSTPVALREALWLSTQWQYFKLQNYAQVQALLTPQWLTQFSQQAQIRGHFIAAKIALYDVNIESALAYLAKAKGLLINQAAVNLHIELHLLYSNAEFSSGNLTAGKQHLDKIGQLIVQAPAEQAVNLRLQTEYFDNQGHYYLLRFRQQGNGDPALLQTGLQREYQALAESALTGDLDKQISLHSNIAALHKSAWHFSSAIRNYLIALHYLQEHNSEMYQLYVYRNLGALYSEMGAYANALLFLQQAQQRAKRLTPYWDAKIDCLIAEAKHALTRAQASTAATSCLNKFARLARQKHYQDDYLDALRVHAQITRQASSDRVQQLQQAVVNITQSQVATRILLWLAEQQPEMAQAYYDRAILLSQTSSAPSLRALAPMQAARWALVHQAGSAESYIQQSLQSIEYTAKQLHPAELGPAWSNKVNAFFSEVIAWYLQQKDSLSAFQIYERSRALSLRTSANNINQQAIRNAQSVARLTEISALSAMQGNKAGKSSDFHLQVQRNLLRLQQIYPQDSPLLAELAWFEQHQHQLVEAAQQLASPLALHQVQQKLSPYQQVLAYFVANGHYQLFTITKDKFTHYQLAKQSETDPLITQLQTLLSDPASAPWEHLRLLAQQLLPEPVKQDVAGYQEWVVIPFAQLNQLPFASLPIAPGSPLINQVSLRQIPSLSAWLQESEQRSKPRSTLALAVFADPDTQQHATSKGAWNQQLAALPWSAYEANALRRLFGQHNSHFYLKNHANRANLLSAEVRNADILHIATHSYFDATRPNAVGFTLSLTDQQGRQDPGFVTFAELASYPFSNRLVFINGCESAMGKVARGEGMQGMARNFLLSGANNVIATLWPVSDSASARLVEHFYQALITNNNPAVALQQAQKSMLKHPRYRHPFYWAAHTVYSM